MEDMRSAVILAGGAGSRLGEDKSLIDFDGRPLIQWSVDLLAKVVDDVVVVARDNDQANRLNVLLPDANITCDHLKGYGPVAGLDAGMEKAKGTYSLAVGCDLPFLNPKVIELLFELAIDFEAAIPIKENGMIEPLHAVYKREALHYACQRALVLGEKRIRTPLRDLRGLFVEEGLIKEIDFELLTFFNINTKENLAIARRLWPYRIRDNASLEYKPRKL
jgi:molybdopterin-guanine dinucleotide biosynthesis protein A